jgi:hypothetical protein
MPFAKPRGTGISGRGRKDDGAQCPDACRSRPTSPRGFPMSPQSLTNILQSHLPPSSVPNVLPPTSPSHHAPVVRAFVDFWNFQIAMDRWQPRFRFDWSRLCPSLAAHVEALWSDACGRPVPVRYGGCTCTSRTTRRNRATRVYAGGRCEFSVLRGRASHAQGPPAKTGCRLPERERAVARSCEIQPMSGSVLGVAGDEAPGASAARSGLSRLTVDAWARRAGAANVACSVTSLEPGGWDVVVRLRAPSRCRREERARRAGRHGVQVAPAPGREPPTAR